MAGYTIQSDDGAGFYRLTDTSIQLEDTSPALTDDGLRVLVECFDADAAEVELHYFRFFGLDSEGRDDGMQRTHPGQRARFRGSRTPAR